MGLPGFAGVHGVRRGYMVYQQNHGMAVHLAHMGKKWLGPDTGTQGDMPKLHTGMPVPGHAWWYMVMRAYYRVPLCRSVQEGILHGLKVPPTVRNEVRALTLYTEWATPCRCGKWRIKGTKWHAKVAIGENTAFGLAWPGGELRKTTCAGTTKGT